MSLPTIIFDIDGTLANLDHRKHWVTGSEKNWEKFFSEMSKDIPYPGIKKLAQIVCLSRSKYHICTARPQRYRDLTSTWLKDNISWLFFNVSSGLLMRADGDRRKDIVVKKEMLDNIRYSGFNPVLALEDNPEVVEMYRSEGLEVLQTKTDHHLEEHLKTIPWDW